jgi:hypothetical protein
MDLGHWEYIGDFDVNDWFGFIYRIVDNTNGRHYIGKKQFFSYRKKPPLKSKVRKRKVVNESNWRTYTSSSAHVNDAIKEKGKENFTFLIESLHKTKASLTYAEVETQINEDVLRVKLPNGERKYYNGMIANIKFLPPEEISEETRAKIKQTMKLYWLNTEHHYYNQFTEEQKEEWRKKYFIGDNNPTKRNKTKEEYNQWLLDTFIGENNPIFERTGDLSPRLGKSCTENWSEERLAEFKKKMSELTSGEKNGMYGRNPYEHMSDEWLANHKKMLSEKMRGPNNPSYGVDWTEKKTEEELQEWKEKISKATKGKPKSEETKLKMKKPKGPQPRVICPHCNKEGGKSNMDRYHFDKCKIKPS